MKRSLASFVIAGAAALLSTSARGATVILHKFTGGASDGSAPYSSLTLSGSMLYGMTTGGGSGGGQGVIFSMRTDGTSFGLLHNFTGEPNDGAFPEGSLTLSGSKLYGMTGKGGVGNGTIFSINVDGTGYSLLRSFTGRTSDGGVPVGSLTLSGSSLYGMTVFGGSNSAGTLFSMNVDGTGFSLLHSFTGGVSDGDFPLGSLTLVGSTLYGMTNRGGSRGLGTIFSIGTDGTGFTLLDSFRGGPARETLI